MSLSARALYPLAVVLAALSACAPAARRPVVVDPASIEVANRTTQDYAIYLDGQHVADLPSGEHTLVDGLVSGSHRLVATPSHGRTGEQQTTLELAVGGSALWDLIPEPPEAPLDVPRGFGTVRLINDVGADLSVLLDGKPAARLLSGNVRQLHAVSAGPHEIEARRGFGHAPIVMQIELRPGEELDLPIDGPRGSLEVQNGSGEPVEVTVDDTLVGTVEAGGVRTFERILAGVRTVAAVGEQTRRRHQREQRVLEGERAVWHVQAAAGAVQVVNDTPETVRVELDDLEIGRVPPGESRLVADVTLGDHELRATTMTTGVELRMPVEIRTDQTFVWPLSVDEGVLILENATDEAVQIYRDDEPYLRLEPTQSRALSQIPAGTYALSAFGERSHRIVPRKVEVQAARSVRWTIRPEWAALEVHNARAERVRLHLDAKVVGELAPGERRVLEGLVAGEQLVEVLGLTSGRVTRDRAVLVAHETVRVDIGDPMAAVIIVNRSGEPLRVDPALAPQGAVVPEGASWPYAVSTARKRLTVTGEETGHQHELPISLVHDETRTWEVEEPVGHVEVFNHRDEAVHLWFDGARAGTVPAGGSLLLADRPVGRHELLATGAESGQGVRAVRRIEAGKANNWQVGHEVAVLQVVNDTGEDQEVFIGERPYGRVLAGETHAFGGIPAGARMLKLEGQRSQEIQQAMLQFEEGRTERFRVRPLNAGLRVLNERPVAVSVFLDGERVGEAPAKGLYEGFLTQGPHTVETRDLDTLESTLTHLTASPYQTYDVRVTPRHGTLRITNTTPASLEIRRGERLVGTLEAGASRTFRNLPAERQVLKASDGDRSWTLDVLIDDEAEGEWVIRPAGH